VNGSEGTWNDILKEGGQERVVAGINEGQEEGKTGGRLLEVWMGGH